jgi:hypothetical protein
LGVAPRYSLLISQDPVLRDAPAGALRLQVIRYILEAIVRLAILINSVIALSAVLSVMGQQPANLPPLARDPGAFPLGDTQGTGSKGKGPTPVAGPTPHLPDGRPDFGGDGAWYPGFAGNIAEPQWKGVRSADKHVDVPFLPESIAVFNERVQNFAKDDPEARCLPVGVPRYMFDPYPFEIIQLTDRVIFLFEGDNHPWRIVRIDPGKKHADNINPTWMGDGVGWYEGDTLVIDVIGFNDKSWLDQAGHPHTERMHLIERYTRTDTLTLKYEVTIDDPGAYARPWVTSNTVRWRPGLKLMEYVCYENEKDADHMKSATPR